MSKLVRLSLCCIVLLSMVTTVRAYEGYEPQATGGAGGTTVHVTNLNDSGAGSLRAVIAGLTGSPTIIVFDVSGVICVSGEIRITKANVTIDGSTAPTPGITVANAPGTQFGIDVNGDANIIIKHMRFRNAGLEDLQIWEGGKITIDHCSFSGSGDGALDVNTANHLIISRCIFGGCVEVHKAHGTYVSAHHNLYAWNNRRQPRIYGAGPYWDFRNNIVEFWTNSGTNILVSDAVNIINNWYGDPSPESVCSSGFWSINDATNVYTNGNYSLCGQNIDAFGNRGTPNLEPSVTTTDAQTAYNSVLADCGAQPNDAIDQYYIAGGGTNPPAVASCGAPPPPPPPTTPDISLWLKGDVHYHTTNSDGSETVATMVTGYRDTGLHKFSCIADHDYISDASAYSNSTFVGVNGVEASGGPHVVGFGVSGSGSFSGGTTLQSAIDAINTAGGVPMVAHARWSQENMSYDMPTLLANMTNCNLMSVYNWYCQDLWGNGNSEAYWDTLLTDDKVIYGYAEDDTHGLGRQGYTFNRIGLAAADLSLANLKTVLSNGTFYFGYSATKWGNGITVSAYTVTGISDGDTISITTNGATNIQFIGDGGAVLQSTDAASATYTILGTEPYVRVKCTNTAGDITWMQPVFIGGGGGGRPGRASNPSPANGATGVSTTATLSWTAGVDANSHDVYFGTTNPPSFKQNQTATTYNPGTLASSTTYYWRIDEKNSFGTTTGVVWSFTTQSGGTTVFTSLDTKDGWIKESTETSGVGGTCSSTATYLGDTSTKQQYLSVLHFDTSSLPDGATITAATLTIRRLGVYGTPTNLGSITVDIKNGYYGSTDTLKIEDFQAASSATNVATLTPYPASNGAYSSGSLDSTGRAQINKTGVTQFKIRFTTDDDNDSTGDYLNIYDSTSNPSLSVTWQ